MMGIIVDNFAGGGRGSAGITRRGLAAHAVSSDVAISSGTSVRQFFRVSMVHLLSLGPILRLDVRHSLLSDATGL